MDTPVPISNTAVKHFNADDSVSENRKLPIFFFAFFHGVKYINIVVLIIFFLL